jgi:hypothetical protein
MTDVVAELTRLNEAFAAAKLTTDVGFFRTHLAEGLQFRRASGKVVDKNRYLSDLGAPENTNDRVAAHEIEVLTYGADLAVCSLLVDFKGTRGGKPSEGMVRNTRVFVRSDWSWKCALWLNTNDVRPGNSSS